MRAITMATLLVVALLSVACECAILSYLTNDNGEVIVRVRPSPPPSPPSGIPHSYYKVLSDNEHPLTTLMRESDLIVQATCVGLVVSNGGWPYVVDNEAVSFLCVVQIKRILGSVWDRAELANHLAVWHSTFAKADLSNIVFVVFHRMMMQARERDAMLGINGDYLLFLADYPMTEAPEQMGVSSACLFKTVQRSRGAVLLTPPEKLWRVTDALDVRMYANKTTVLSNQFNTTDTSVILNAVGAIATDMRSGGPPLAAPAAAEALKGLARLRLDTNGNVCTLTNQARFKIINTDLK